MDKKSLFFLVGILFYCSLICNSQTNRNPIDTPKITSKNGVPLQDRLNWQLLDIEKNIIPGTSLERAYKEIIGDKKGKQIIVAVIDTDIDINHEDLKQAIWKNKKEIPNNGKDDDHNGYIDDINGWNFLGNKKGENIVYANNESTRIIKKLKKKYTNYPKFNGNAIDSLLYLQAIKNNLTDRQEIATLKVYASENLSQYRDCIKQFQKQFNRVDFSLHQLDSLYNTYANTDNILANTILIMWDNVRLGKDYESFKNDSIKVEEKLATTYNENYYDRNITEDNEFDIKDNRYGNNNVSKNAKWTYHGTIVSGILAANRNNKIGVDGFSDQIKIMPILAIPSGGYEHDKDIALAIRYAVDNGAKIINMSFGKTSSAFPEWVKEAFLYAEKHDVLLVAGSGNDASNSDITPFYPIDYDEQTGIEFCNNFIKVGGITYVGNKDFLASFTNYGKKTVDIFAPGYFMRTTDANVGYSYRDGTSLSSPVVSGVAALIRSYYPNLKANQVKQILLDSGVSYDLNVTLPTITEETVLKPFSELSKSGKVVNAYNALLMAKEYNKNKK